MNYKDLTPEQKKLRNENLKKRRAKQREKYRERNRKRYAENPEKYLERSNRRYLENPEKYNERKRKYMSEDVNSDGVPKANIRTSSRRILCKSHSKLKDYEIHHCFGYEDPNKFIYIPRDLHLKIHQLLRDNKIPSDSNHWNAIRDLVNSCEEYTYIRI